MGERAYAFAPVEKMWELFVSFFKIGLFTFGGGYAMLPMIQREIEGKRKWCTEAELLDYYAIGQCTPGVIAVNCATLVGFKIGGYIGAAVATAAVVLPSICIIIPIAACIASFAEYPVVQHALAGIRVAVAVLVLRTVISLYKKNIKTAASALVFFLALILSLVFHVSSVYIVLAAILGGLLYGTQWGKGEEK